MLPNNLLDKINSLTVKKIVIVGFPGSGKTALGKKLSQELNIPHIEADKYFWVDNNNHLQPQDLRKLIKEEINSYSSWVYEGHFKTCHDIVMAQTSMVIEIKKSFLSAFFIYLSREIKRKDISVSTKFSRIFYVPFNLLKITKSKRDALRNFKGEIYKFRPTVYIDY